MWDDELWEAIIVLNDATETVWFDLFCRLFLSEVAKKLTLFWPKDSTVGALELPGRKPQACGQAWWSTSSTVVPEATV